MTDQGCRRVQLPCAVPVPAADNAGGPQAARSAALVYLLFFTGIRVSEAIGADIDDYEIHKATKGRGLPPRESTHVAVVPAPAALRIKAYLADCPRTG